MSYNIHKSALPASHYKLFHSGVFENKVDVNGFIDFYDILETNIDVNYNSGAETELSNYYKTGNVLNYIHSQYAPNYATTFDLASYFGNSNEEAPSGVLLGGSPSFKRCVYSSINDAGQCLTGDIVFQLTADEEDKIPYIQIKRNNLIVGSITADDYGFAQLPHKFLFVVQGAGGGGGGGAELGGLFAGGSGGGGGGLAAVVVDFSDGSGEVTVHLGAGGIGSAEGSKTNGADGGESYITSDTKYCYIYGGNGGGYARSVNISEDPRAGGGAGGTVENNGFILVLSQNGARGGDRGGTEASDDGASFGITKITLPTSQLVYKELNATGGAGGASPRYAGGGAGSFFGVGGAGGKDNAGASGNPGGNGTYGAGGGGGGDNALDNNYGKGGNGGDAVLKIYY